MSEAYLVELGQMPYSQAWDWQRRIGQAVGAGELPDTVLFVEHPPVYTVGRGAHGSLENLLWDEDRRRQEGIELYLVDRGGDITYHGPGQLVGYPIVNLERHGRDVRQYLRRLEGALIETLRQFAIEAGRLDEHTGVWVGTDKIAAIGVKATQWITQHGFALNVDPQLEHFSGIIPCGINDKGVTSMSKILGRPLLVDTVMPAVQASLAAEFGFQFSRLPIDTGPFNSE
jgi:lipoyl(octanoyl) transferase